MTIQAKHFMHILTCNSYKDGEHCHSILEVVLKSFLLLMMVAGFDSGFSRVTKA